MLLTACVLAATLFLPQTVGAQTSSPSRFSLGVEGGAQAVQNVGGLLGAQLSGSVSSRFDVFGEAVYLQDVVTRRRAESATDVATYLAQTQGKAATGTLEIPTWAFTGGGKVFLADFGHTRLYAAGQAGAAHVTLSPTFTLGGADITSTLPQYGVTLGADLTGSSVCAVVGGGIGVLANHGHWYFDAAFRVLSIQMETQPAHALTIAVGFGRNF